MNLAILVNSTDSFEDCWVPFFTLFKKYWPEYRGTVYLNTECKNFELEGIKIKCIQSGLTESSWSECLGHAVGQIKEDHFIYMQEDYFLKSRVSDQLVYQFYDCFLRSELDCLHLTDQCTSGPFKESLIDERIWYIGNNAPYRVSTQAAIWKKSALLRILRPWESGWDFEKFGTLRSLKSLPVVACINQSQFRENETEVLPYVFTGIIKGKWKPEVVQLFAANDIPMDFSYRGFTGIGSRSLAQRLETFLRLIRAQVKNVVFERRYQKLENKCRNL